MSSVTPELGVRRVRVETAPAYDVVVGAGVLDRLGGTVRAVVGEPTGIVIVSDHLVAPLHAEAVRTALAGIGPEPSVFVTAAGEGSKTLAGYGAVIEALASARLDRGGLVVALGGGVVGDLAGFAAATYLRGVRFVQVPTTLLAMVDSSVGGKTGINLAVGKNLVGAFWQPAAVVADIALLASLPPEVLRHGGVELYKAGLLGDADIVEAFEARGFGDVLSLRDDLVDLIARGVAVKAGIVAADPRERGARAFLNLGHTVGHALESLAAGALPHGAAVAYGLVAAAEIGARRGLLDWRARAHRLCRWAADVPPPDVSLQALLDRLGRDKKQVGSRRRFVLLEDVGQPILVEDVHDDEVREGLRAVREVAT